MPYDKPRGPRSGSSGPRRSFGDKPSYGPRTEGGERPRRAYGDKPSYGPRTEGGERPRRSFGDKPAYAPRSYGDKPSYGPRTEGGERPRRAYGDKPAYAPRSYGDKPSYGPRTEGGERPRRSFGDKPAYTPRPYGDKPAFGDRKPYAPRAPREGGEGYTPRPRAEGAERPAYVKEWGDARKPKYDAKPDRKAQFERKRDAETTVLANGDGWLVGNHAVLAALKNGRRKVREVWLLAEATGELASVLAAHPEWPVQMKAREDFNREFAEAVHQGVAVLVGNLSQPSLPELLATAPQLVVALDQVTDPHNLGAIVRSAAAFGVGGVLVTEHRAAGVNATAAKAAAGALESVPVAEVTNLAQALKMLNEAGYVAIGLAGEAEAELGEVLGTLPQGQKVCLVVGSEGEGLRRLTRENCAHLAKIAIASTVESLNVSVATGVALALISRR